MPTARQRPEVQLRKGVSCRFTVTRFPEPQRVGKHAMATHRTTCVLTHGGRKTVTHAFCSEVDWYDGERGRAVAFGKAIAQFAKRERTRLWSLLWYALGTPGGDLGT